MYTKESRIDELIAICVKNNKTPREIGFADFIYRIAATRFLATKATIKNYLQIMIPAWQHDKWKHLVQVNAFLTMEEKETWLKHMKKS